MRTITVGGLALLVTCGAILAGEGQIEIGPTSAYPIVISEPGSYLLTANLAPSLPTDAIQIDADDVVLDLGGHHIQGSGVYSDFKTGVRNISPRSGITVRNGSISGFYVCLALGGEPGGNLVEDVHVSSCQSGMVLSWTSVLHSSARNCSASGIQAWNGSTITSSVSTYSGTGFSLWRSSCFGCTAGFGAIGFTMSQATCDGCTAYQNDLYGFAIGDSGSLLTSSSGFGNTSGNISGSCSTGNVCVNNNLP